MREALEQLMESLGEWSEAVGSQILILFEQLRPTLKGIYDALWVSYREAGAPYGESDEGLMRWVTEVNQAQRLRTKADGIIEHHRMLAQIRQIKSTESRADSDREG